MTLRWLNLSREGLESAHAGNPNESELKYAHSSDSTPPATLASRFPMPITRTLPHNRNGKAGGDTRPAVPSLVSTFAADIAPQAVEWLWENRVPSGAVVILDGNPGSGKTMLAVALATAVSTGRALPGGKKSSPADVLFLSVEDDQARTIRPRLEAAGADLRRVRVSDGTVAFGAESRCLMLPNDADVLRQLIGAGVKLVILDPLMGFLNPGFDANKDQEVRQAIGFLKRIAEESGCVILAIRHLNKTTGGTALFRGSGSIAISAVARSVLLVGPLPGGSGDHVLAVVKCNLGPKPPALKYVIGTARGMPLIEWRGETEIEADELVPGDVPARPCRASEVERCVAWLREFLASGPIPAKELEQAAAAARFTAATLRRARGILGTLSEKARGGAGCWMVRLPATSPEPNTEEPSKGEDSHGIGPLGHVERLAPLDPHAPHPVKEDQEAQGVQLPQGGPRQAVREDLDHAPTAKIITRRF